MAKVCPVTGRRVLYLQCLECEDKECRDKKEDPCDECFKTGAYIDKDLCESCEHYKRCIEETEEK